MLCSFDEQSAIVLNLCILINRLGKIPESVNLKIPDLADNRNTNKVLHNSSWDL